MPVYGLGQPIRRGYLGNIPGPISRSRMMPYPGLAGMAGLRRPISYTPSNLMGANAPTPLSAGLARIPKPRVISNPQAAATRATSNANQAGLDIMGIVNPQIAAITKAMEARARAGGEAISGYTNQLAQNLAGMDLGRPYSGAIQQQAASDAALSQILAGGGTEQAAQLGQRLAAIDAPGATQAAQQAVTQAGTGAAGALYGTGTAERGNLIAQQASARQYGGTLPGLAGLTGAQQLGELQRQVASDLSERVGGMVAQVPELVMNRQQQLVENARNAAADALAQRQFGLQQKQLAEDIRGRKATENLATKQFGWGKTMDLFNQMKTKKGFVREGKDLKFTHKMALDELGLTTKQYANTVKQQAETNRQWRKSFNYAKDQGWLDRKDARAAAKLDRAIKNKTILLDWARLVSDSAYKAGSLEMIGQRLGLDTANSLAKVLEFNVTAGQRDRALGIQETTANNRALVDAARIKSWDAQYGPGGLDDRRIAVQEQKLKQLGKQGGYSKDDVIDFRKTAGKLASAAWNGTPTMQTDPDTGEAVRGRSFLSYQEAMREGLAQRIPLTIMQKALGTYWSKPGMRGPNDPPGEGRPVVDFQFRPTPKQKKQDMKFAQNIFTAPPWLQLPS